MTDLNITYYFGQIKSEYRGDMALFIEKEGERKEDIHFKLYPLASLQKYNSGDHSLVEQVRAITSAELLKYTGGDHSPIRSYLGVNSEAKEKVEERFKRGNLSSAFSLDHVIVREEIVKRRLEEINGLAYSTLEAAVATGK